MTNDEKRAVSDWLICDGRLDALWAENRELEDRIKLAKAKKWESHSVLWPKDPDAKYTEAKYYRIPGETNQLLRVTDYDAGVVPLVT